MSTPSKEGFSRDRIASQKADELRANQDFSMVWSRRGPNGQEEIVAERVGGGAVRFSINPDGSVDRCLGKIDRRRDDRAHPTRLTRFVPDNGKPTDLDRNEF